MTEDWNQVANGNYSAASLLVQNRKDRSGISRAYYAAYARATKALSLSACMTFPTGREGPTHAKLPRLVEDHLAELQQDRYKVSGLLRALYKMRVTADYQPSVIIDAVDSKKALVHMAQIFQLTKGVV